MCIRDSDCTNTILPPLCSVITTIGLDHTAILGNTIEEIAVEAVTGLYILTIGTGYVCLLMGGLWMLSLIHI